MKNRKGQALLVVIIIMAVVMAVFANSLTTGIRSHSLTETEVYQREQALYLAETGVNRMIFNINNGATYNDGDSISGTVSGIGSYESIYHTPDDSGYGGSAYIESIGTVGEFSRKIFVSVQKGDGNEAFKYCLYTSQGGRDGINNDYFTNNIYGVNYRYNTQPDSSMPHPDMTQYGSHWQRGYYFVGSSAIYRPFEWNDNNKVVYIEARGSSPTTLTVDFQNYSSIKLSLATNATNVIIKNMNGSFQWRPADEYEGYTFPIITHSGTGEVEFDFNNFGNNWNETLELTGFIYTAGHIFMNYDATFWWIHIPISKGVISGEVMEGDPQGKLGGDDGTRTNINYVTTDYYTNPPPFFPSAGNGKAKVFPGSFREEY